jgi:hypothetical protein
MKNVVAYIIVQIVGPHCSIRKENMIQEVDGHRIGRHFQKVAFNIKENGMGELKFHVKGAILIWVTVSK